MSTDTSEFPAWDEAFLRVESYLRAHHVKSRVALNLLTLEIIAEAKTYQEEQPSMEPVAAALHVTHQHIGRWFAQMGKPEDWSDEWVRARGRLALVLADLPARCADVFLTAKPVPPQQASALREAVLQPGPELRLTTMVPAPLEFGFEEPDTENLYKGSRGFVVQAAAGWMMMLGIYGTTWFALH